jgi:2-polyprenyl-6-hydroxyphenyl methylase/3-demethylubiquinone-9 3-methyltransferase
MVGFRNPIAEIRKYKENRGMSFWYDVKDMLGGYPYEFATSDEIFRFCRHELGLQLENLNSTWSVGCNEFLFTAPADRKPSAPIAPRR